MVTLLAQKFSLRPHGLNCRSSHSTTTTQIIICQKHPSNNMRDYTNSLPDECLVLIFNFLTTTNDRNNSSLVSRRWLQIDAQTRTHLTLNAHPDIQPFIPSIFTRFNSLTQLVLCTKFLFSINDNDMILITSMCPNLTRLKLRDCGKLTDSGMAVFSKNCKNLKEFSCVWCAFSDLGIAELLDNCSQLQVLSVRMLKSRLSGDKAPSNFRAAKSLNVIKLSYVDNERLFEPLIIASKNLKCLKLICGDGSWDTSLEMIPEDSCLVEVHLEECYVTDVGLSSFSKCRDLNSLSIVDNVLCTNVGLISVAENCKGLKTLCVGHWNMSEIGDEGLIAVGKHSVNLEELVLIVVNATCVCLEVIATNCQNLVRLELFSCKTITDAEMMCIAEKCVALKILCIEECGVSNKGIEAFALGCPNLAEIRLTKCENVTCEVKDWLIARRGGQIECNL